MVSSQILFLKTINNLILSLLYTKVLLIQHFGIQVASYHRALFSPRWGLSLQRKMVSMRDVIRDIIDRSVRVYTAFLIDELIGRLAVRDDYHIRGTDSEGKYRAVLVGPYFKSVWEQK